MPAKKTPARKTKSKRSDLKAHPKSAKATEQKFGKAARAAAEKGGRKPTAWQTADKPKRLIPIEPTVPVDIFAPKAAVFDVVVTRTLDGSMSDVFRAFNDPNRRGWCHERGFAVRSTIAPRMLRLAFADGSLAGVAIVRQGNVRCTVTVDLTKLPSAAAAERARHAWKMSLDQLAGMLDE